MAHAPRRRTARIRNRLPVRLVRRFARREEGAAAVEFALVALPFLALTFAILETALVFFAGQTLEAAVADSARLIMTGQAQTANYAAKDFKDQVCSRIASLFDCQTGVYVDVKSYANFGAITSAQPVTDSQFDPSKVGFSLAGPGCIQVVTLYYQWPIYVSLLGNNLANLNGSYRLLAATAVFRNEPYATSGGCTP